MADYAPDFDDRPLGHHYPLGLNHAEQQFLGARSLSILDLSTFFPFGFPEVEDWPAEETRIEPSESSHHEKSEVAVQRSVELGDGGSQGDGVNSVDERAGAIAKGSTSLISEPVHPRSISIPNHPRSNHLNTSTTSSSAEPPPVTMGKDSASNFVVESIPIGTDGAKESDGAEPVAREVEPHETPRNSSASYTTVETAASTSQQETLLTTAEASPITSGSTPSSQESNLKTTETLNKKSETSNPTPQESSLTKAESSVSSDVKYSPGIPQQNLAQPDLLSSKPLDIQASNIAPSPTKNPISTFGAFDSLGEKQTFESVDTHQSSDSLPDLEQHPGKARFNEVPSVAASSSTETNPSSSISQAIDESLISRSIEPPNTGNNTAFISSSLDTSTEQIQAAPTPFQHIASPTDLSPSEDATPAIDRGKADSAESILPSAPDGDTAEQNTVLSDSRTPQPAPSENTYQLSERSAQDKNSVLRSEHSSSPSEVLRENVSPLLEVSTLEAERVVRALDANPHAPDPLAFTTTTAKGIPDAVDKSSATTPLEIISDPKLVPASHEISEPHQTHLSPPDSLTPPSNVSPPATNIHLLKSHISPTPPSPDTVPPFNPSNVPHQVTSPDFESSSISQTEPSSLPGSDVFSISSQSFTSSETVVSLHEEEGFSSTLEEGLKMADSELYQSTRVPISSELDQNLPVSSEEDTTVNRLFNSETASIPESSPSSIDQRNASDASRVVSSELNQNLTVSGANPGLTDLSSFQIDPSGNLGGASAAQTLHLNFQTSLISSSEAQSTEYQIDRDTVTDTVETMSTEMENYFAQNSFYPSSSHPSPTHPSSPVPFHENNPQVDNSILSQAEEFTSSSPEQVLRKIDINQSSPNTIPPVEISTHPEDTNLSTIGQQLPSLSEFDSLPKKPLEERQNSSLQSPPNPLSSPISSDSYRNLADAIADHQESPVAESISSLPEQVSRKVNPEQLSLVQPTIPSVFDTHGNIISENGENNNISLPIESPLLEQVSRKESEEKASNLFEQDSDSHVITDSSFEKGTDERDKTFASHLAEPGHGSNEPSTIDSTSLHLAEPGHGSNEPSTIDSTSFALEHISTTAHSNQLSPIQPGLEPLAIAPTDEIAGAIENTVSPPEAELSATPEQILRAADPTGLLTTPSDSLIANAALEPTPETLTHNSLDSPNTSLAPSPQAPPLHEDKDFGSTANLLNSSSPKELNRLENKSGKIANQPINASAEASITLPIAEKVFRKTDPSQLPVNLTSSSTISEPVALEQNELQSNLFSTSESSSSEVPNSDVSQIETSQPEIFQSNVSHLDISQPEVFHSDISQGTISPSWLTDKTSPPLPVPPSVFGDLSRTAHDEASTPSLAREGEQAFPPYPPTPSLTGGEAQQEYFSGNQSPSPALGEGFGVRAIDLYQSTASPSDTAPSDTLRSDISQSETLSFEVAGSEVSEPKVSVPEILPLEGFRPGGFGSEVSKTKGSAPEISRFEASNSEVPNSEVLEFGSSIQSDASKQKSFPEDPGTQAPGSDRLLGESSLSKESGFKALGTDTLTQEVSLSEGAKSEVSKSDTSVTDTSPLKGSEFEVSGTDTSIQETSLIEGVNSKIFGSEASEPDVFPLEGSQSDISTSGISRSEITESRSNSFQSDTPSVVEYGLPAGTEPISSSSEQILRASDPNISSSPLFATEGDDRVSLHGAGLSLPSDLVVVRGDRPSSPSSPSPETPSDASVSENLLPGALQPIGILQSLTSETLVRKRSTEPVLGEAIAPTIPTPSDIAPPAAPAPSPPSITSDLPSQWSSLAELMFLDNNSQSSNSLPSSPKGQASATQSPPPQPSTQSLSQNITKAKTPNPSLNPPLRRRLSIPKQGRFSGGSNTHLQAQFASPISPSTQFSTPTIQPGTDASFTTITANASSPTDTQALEQLAQEIYYLLRQRLAIEQERHGRIYPKRFS